MGTFFGHAEAYNIPIVTIQSMQVGYHAGTMLCCFKRFCPSSYRRRNGPILLCYWATSLLLDEQLFDVCWGLNSHCFPIVGMAINLVVGVYIPIVRSPYYRWDDHPQCKEWRSIDPGTCDFHLGEIWGWWSFAVPVTIRKYTSQKSNIDTKDCHV